MIYRRVASMMVRAALLLGLRYLGGYGVARSVSQVTQPATSRTFQGVRHHDARVLVLRPRSGGATKDSSRKTPRWGGGHVGRNSECAQYTGMNMGRAGMSAVCPFACGGFRNILRTPRHLLGGYMVARSRLLQACEQQTTQQSARAAGNGSLHGGSTVGQPSVQPFIPNASCWNVQDCTQQTNPFNYRRKDALETVHRSL